MIKKKIYLAHSVHERELGKQIQFKLENDGYEVWNPFYPPKNLVNVERTDIEELDKGHIQPWDITNKERSMWIIDTDLMGVQWADIVICIFPEGVTYGITCEMMAAWMHHKIVYSVVPESRKGHPWIVGMSTMVFTDINELRDELPVVIFLE